MTTTSPHLNHPFSTLEDAAAQAYSLASQWGGDWLVMARPTDGFIIRAGSGIPRAEYAGAKEVGRYVSPDSTIMSWKWADGRNAPAPQLPERPKPAEPKPIPREITKEVAQLSEAMNRVILAQRAFNSGNPMEARKLIFAEPSKTPAPLQPGPYLMACIERGVVERELLRITTKIDAVREAFNAGDARRASERLFGDVPAPKQASAEPPTPAEPAISALDYVAQTVRANLDEAAGGLAAHLKIEKAEATRMLLERIGEMVEAEHIPDESPGPHL